jgi:trans-aconitate 2-methyltransferase
LPRDSSATYRAAVPWDPSQYLRYADERLRPALDLMARIAAEAPRRVVDLGCGPGNVTALLKQRWPRAEVTGVDGSAPMLAKAAAAAPDCRFIEADIAAWTPGEPPELLYSNAALHWLPGHATLFPRLLSLLAPGGTLAVQMPAMHAEPLRALQGEIAANGPWADLLVEVDAARPILEPGAYWDLLKPRAAALEIWETIYLHALQGEDAIVQWASGTSLRPFLDRLAAPMREDFRRAYADAVRPVYPRRPDGTTLLPFRRLFLVATV